MPRFLITGATGKQGGACINALLAKSADYEIYALTRKANSPAAQKLAARGVRIVEGNTADSQAIFSKVGGQLDGVFLVQPSAGGGQSVRDEERQGKAFFDAAQKAGVKHFVYASVPHGSRPTVVDHWASKHRIEDYITANATISWTFLQPVCFMDNFLGKGFQARLLFTALEAYMGPQKPLHMIATEDIGNVAAHVLLNPDTFKSKSLPLAGDCLDLPRMQRIYSETAREKSSTTFHFLVRFIFGVLVPDMGRMFKWFGEEGYPDESITVTKEIYPGVLDFETWARRNLAPNQAH